MKTKKLIYSLTIIPLVIVFILFVWFLSIIFEGEKPRVACVPLPEYLSGIKKFTLDIGDRKRGLKRLKVTLNQEGREVVVLDREFAFVGLLNRDGTHDHEQEIHVDPSSFGLAQGRVDLNISVWDYSKNGGGDGNMTLAQHKMIVDTIPPAIRAISRMNNINRGGSCLVVYQTSSDTQESGVFVEEIFFPGFPADEDSRRGIHLCYFSVPHNSKSKPSIYLWAKDRAENPSSTTFSHHIREKRFRRDKINITDGFLQRVLPYFSFYSFDPEATDVDKFLKINNDLREESRVTLFKLREETGPQKRWNGPWLRLSNAATMAGFADRRSYYYKGKEIDEKVHLGTDLASLANSPVQAANHGRVILADNSGIYGLTVVIDHGQGLASLYGHLSAIEVTMGQMVKKGDVIGFTGQTGLAGGDHLHFGVTVGGIPVNPIEWWDSHWIKDNVSRKLALIGGEK